MFRPLQILPFAIGFLPTLYAYALTVTRSEYTRSLVPCGIGIDFKSEHYFSITNYCEVGSFGFYLPALLIFMLNFYYSSKWVKDMPKVWLSVITAFACIMGYTWLMIQVVERSMKLPWPE
jgi:hypothetical protein